MVAADDYGHVAMRVNNTCVPIIVVMVMLILMMMVVVLGMIVLSPAYMVRLSLYNYILLAVVLLMPTNRRRRILLDIRTLRSHIQIGWLILAMR